MRGRREKGDFDDDDPLTQRNEGRQSERARADEPYYSRSTFDLFPPPLLLPFSVCVCVCMWPPVRTHSAYERSTRRERGRGREQESGEGERKR